MSSRPSIRRLIRRSIVAQIVIGVLVVVVALMMLARSLSLVSQQEDQTRAIGEIRNATVSLLGAVAAIDTYANTGRIEDRARYRAAIADLKDKFRVAAETLEGESAERAAQAAAGVEQWDRDVLSKVAEAVAAGRKREAQLILLSPENDQAIGAAGLTIADLLNGQVVDQLDTDRDTRTFAISVTIAGVLAALILVATASWFLLRIQRFVVPPLEDLQQTARRIGEGDLAARTDPKGTVETSAAAESFNEMAERVESNIDDLREVDKLKDEFVAAVSHELRTPITTARAYLDMYLDGEVGELTEEQRSGIAVISRSIDELADLIDDLLTLTNIEARGERSVNREPVDLERLIAGVERDQRPLYDSAGVKLKVDVPGACRVLADPLRVRQVIVNLLSNARKFSHDGTEVIVTARVSGEFAEIAVRDQGIGITPEELPRIGERFYRAKAVRDVPGTGLGMAIVRELVELHGGELRIVSEPGTGTTITFTLPLAG